MARQAKLPPGDLPWDQLEDIWRKNSTLRQIPYQVADGFWFIGRDDKIFAVLSPGTREGTVHVQEVDAAMNFVGGRGDMPSVEQLIIQLNIAASAAKWRS